MLRHAGAGATGQQQQQQVMGCVPRPALFPVQEQLPMCRTGSSSLEGIELFGFPAGSLMAAAAVGEGASGDRHGTAADVQSSPQILCA